MNNSRTENFAVEELRRDFPLLKQTINSHPLVYFDNAATTQKPQAVIDAIRDYYEKDNSNVHRSVHELSARATMLFEAARLKVQKFINAKSLAECIFVRGTTDAINLVASSMVEPRILEGEEILITQMEHHSNIVPWQLVCNKTGAKLKVVPVTSSGEILVEDFEKALSEKTKFVALTYVSNALGTINPIKDLIAMAKRVGALVLIDGAQATAHLPIDVQALDCDFYCFSAHKMYGPTGIGVLWGKEALLDSMPPYQGGGEMINIVTMEKTEFAALPHKFEAGTPNIAGVIGFGACIDYLNSLDLDLLARYEQYLLTYATEALRELDSFSIIGTATNKIPIFSLVHETIHPHDIGTILDNEGIAIRAGHHCAMPLMDFLGLPATARLSLSFYNTKEEIDYCIKVLQKVKEVFA